MAHKVFVDANILMDLAFERRDFYQEAMVIFHLRDIGRVQIYVSALSLAIVAYFSKKHKKDTGAVIGKFLKWVEVVGLEKKHFLESLTSGIVDFEDALQYYSATEVVGIDAIVTRNKKDFNPSLIPVFTPKEFLTR